MTKRCCFNCSNCFVSNDNNHKLVCRRNGVVKKEMSVNQAENQYCESFEENNDTPDPFD